MALDLGLTTRQLLSALDDVALASRTHAQRLNDTLARGLNRSADAAARRTAAVGRRPYISARTGPEGLLGSLRPPPDVPQDWTALSVDGSHIDVDRHLPLRCHLTNLGGCVHHLRSANPCLPVVQRTRPGRGRRGPLPP